ncbi:MAG: histidine phosphatase family protein [Pseudomonadota bacterium]|nr:histidine phosphatase family protein [Pseudomonadota bacterium]|tara:strand:+ start:37 stop:555 length:519 start_codon:yes stop_codon:yes gene_type:complete
MLLRHASANVSGFGQDNDFEKPLDIQGKIDSKKLSEWFMANFIKLDIIFSSNAKRALQTSEIVFKPLGVNIQKKSTFYLCNHEEIVSSIKKIDDNFNNVVLVGHEPSISDTMRALTGSCRPDLKNFLNIPYEPCTISFIHFNLTRWMDLDERIGTMEEYLHPNLINMKNEKT